MPINSNQTTELPKHHNPTRQYAARAPYNFVPLPDVVIKAVESAEELPDHDRYADGRYTGHFEVTLTTKTPLYIRGGLSTKKPNDNTLSEFEQAEAEKAGNAPSDFRRAMKNKPDFFATHDPNQPVIPGSSLRGMLRSLVEIITYSKMQWVTDRPVIYRAVGDPTSVGDSYREKVLGKNKAAHPNMHFDYPIPRLKGGYLRRTSDGWAIQPAQQFLGESFVRVEYADAGPLIGGRNRHLVHDVYVQPAARTAWSLGRRGPGNLTLNVAVTKNVSLTATSSLEPAKLVESGHMGGNHPKNWHCAIYKPDASAALIDISAEQWRIYQQDRDMTRGFKTRKLTRDGDPLFYLLNAKNELVFFGPTVMFRLPYYKRALDLAREGLLSPDDIDFAEAMFGFVHTQDDTQDELKQMTPPPKQGSKGRAYAGRVFVSDGRYQNDQGSPWMADAPGGMIEPHILASPKPTSFQLYLTQNNPNDRKALYHYDSDTQAGRQVTTLRGFKLYWPQGAKTARDLQATPRDVQDQQRAFETVNDQCQPKASSTQHTRMKPVAGGKKFTFQVHFENLTAVELGALQWALTVPNCHRLGMGKPLGMGVVQLEKVKLQVNSRSDRYKTLLTDNTAWYAGSPETKQDFTDDFESEMIRQLRQHIEVPDQFRQIERIQMLLTMLIWQEQPTDREQKTYMTDLGNDFRPRKVLPDPLHIGGAVTSSTGRPLPSPQENRDRQRNSPHKPGREQQPQKPQPGQQTQPSEPEDKLPEVRENVNPFATLFVENMKEEQDSGKKRKTDKKRKKG